MLFLSGVHGQVDRLNKALEGEMIRAAASEKATLRTLYLYDNMCMRGQHVWRSLVDGTLGRTLNLALTLTLNVPLPLGQTAGLYRGGCAHGEHRFGLLVLREGGHIWRPAVVQRKL